MYPGGLSSAWSVADGIPLTLARMGHDVISAALGRTGQSVTLHKKVLSQCDLIILAGLEHFLHPDRKEEFNFFSPTMTEEDWKSLKIPCIAWYHESFIREDQTYPFERHAPYADWHFFPAVQDAEMFREHAPGQVHWLPAGVDINIFKPETCLACRGKSSLEICTSCYGHGFQPSRQDIAVGFIGSIYRKRQHFITQFLQHCKVPFHVGAVVVQDITGVEPTDTALRLAANYRRCKIFLNMPSLSNLLVTKVYETMACGVMTVTPLLYHDAEKNMDHFESSKHLVYYAPKNLGFLNQTLNNLLEHSDDRNRMALAGMAEVRKNHSLEGRLEEMLRIVGVSESSKVVVN